MNLIPAAISGGAAIGGALIGRSTANSSANKMAASNQQIANQQMAFANQAQQRSQPAYDQAYAYYSGLMKGGPEMQQSLAPSINAINNTYDQNYQNIVNSAYSRGGALDKALRSSQSGKAFALADLYGNAQQQGAVGLSSLASGDATNAARLLGDANASRMNQQQLNQQALSGIGGLITRLFSTPGLFSGGSQSTYSPTQGDFKANGINNPFAVPSAIVNPNFNLDAFSNIGSM